MPRYEVKIERTIVVTKTVDARSITDAIAIVKHDVAKEEAYGDLIGKVTGQSFKATEVG